MSERVVLVRLEHALTRFGDAQNCEERYPGGGAEMIAEASKALEAILAAGEPLPGLRAAWESDREGFVFSGFDAFLREARRRLAQVV